MTPVVKQKRSWVKLDRFATFHLTKEHNLRAGDGFLLLTLIFMADPRSWEVHETLQVIAETAVLGRNTVRTAIERLKNAGLVIELEPFGSGKSAGGSLFIYACVHLIVPETRVARGTTSLMLAALDGATADEVVALALHCDRADFASIGANDQGNGAIARERGSEVARLEEVQSEEDDQERLVLDREGEERCPVCDEPGEHVCVVCGHPVRGHSYHHEPKCDGNDGLAPTEDAETAINGIVMASPLADGSPPPEDEDVDRWTALADDYVVSEEPW